jgi:hypothetical protein
VFTHRVTETANLPVRLTLDPADLDRVTAIEDRNGLIGWTAFLASWPLVLIAGYGTLGPVSQDRLEDINVPLVVGTGVSGLILYFWGRRNMSDPRVEIR